MIDGVDPERFDEVLDRYDEAFSQLKKLITLNPTAKNWRKLCANLLAWPQNDDFDEVVIPWIGQYFGRWQRSHDANAQIPAQWMALIQRGERCPGPGIFTKQRWYDHHIKGLLANVTILQRVKALTLCGRLKQTGWRSILTATSMDNLHSLNIHVLDPTHNPIVWIDEIEAPMLNALHFEHVRLSHRQLEYLLDHPLLAQCNSLSLTDAGLDDHMAQMLMTRYESGQLQNLRFIQLNKNAKISETVCSDLVHTLGSTTLGLSTYGSFTNTQSYFYYPINYEDRLTTHMTQPLELTRQERYATHPGDLIQDDETSSADWDDDWEDDWE